jgi:hypothetical protein
LKLKSPRRLSGGGAAQAVSLDSAAADERCNREHDALMWQVDAARCVDGADNLIENTTASSHWEKERWEKVIQLPNTFSR